MAKRVVLESSAIMDFGAAGSLGCPRTFTLALELGSGKDECRLITIHVLIQYLAHSLVFTFPIFFLYVSKSCWLWHFLNERNIFLIVLADYKL